MFSRRSNILCNNILSGSKTIDFMHEQMERLYLAAQKLKNLKGQSEVAAFLNQSPQTLNNWETRGISKGGILLAHKKIGCSAIWLQAGTGPMVEGMVSIEKWPPNERPPHAAARKVWVIGRGEGGMPDRLWTDGDYPVGASDAYAEEHTDDAHAFIVKVNGDSMAPRYMPGEYVLVEPSIAPELEDDVLVRLANGKTLIKRLLSRRGGIRLGSYSTPEVLTFAEHEITWMYYVSNRVPQHKIKHWLESTE